MIQEWLPFEPVGCLPPDEQDIAGVLSVRLMESWPFLMAHDQYYNGTQRMKHLGISVPPELQDKLRAATGWPRVIVDAIRYKLRVAGFRYESVLDADSQMWKIWTANKMRQRSQLAHLAALKYGRAFLVAGSDGPYGMPLLTAESPANMAAEYDARTMQVTAALQRYRFWGAQAAALYLPDVTVYLTCPEGGAWQVTERDEHNMGMCPVTILSNRAELEDLYGRSEITPEVMAITDVACRRLLGMDIAAEFFSSPQRWVIGAAMTSFQDTDGNPLSAWQSYIGRILALERDEEGELPSVGQFSANSPQPFIDVLQFYARLMSAASRVGASRLGLQTDNPVSAEAIRAEDAQLDELARNKHDTFADAYMTNMQHALMIANGGTLPEDAQQLEVMWANPSVPSPLVTAQAVMAQVQSGVLPPTSDVAMDQLGYTPAEQERIKADRKRATGQTDLAAIATALSSGSLAKELGADAGNADPAGAQAAAQGDAAAESGAPAGAGR